MTQGECFISIFLLEIFWEERGVWGIVLIGGNFRRNGPPLTKRIEAVDEGQG